MKKVKLKISCQTPFLTLADESKRILTYMVFCNQATVSQNKSTEINSMKLTKMMVSMTFIFILWSHLRAGRGGEGAQVVAVVGEVTH